LHLGNVVAFTAAWLSARAASGRVLLRIEDVDQGRARAEIAQGQRDDLAWLGLTWDDEAPPQSARDYAPWLAALRDVYRCGCSRRDVALAGGVYPGTCRELARPGGAVRQRLADGVHRFIDRVHGRVEVHAEQVGDPILQRRDGAFAYPLAVVVDDIVDGVTEVVRGADLLPATICQVALWRAFGMTPPTWAHTPIVLGADGRKLSKSHASLSIAAMRAAGWTPEQVLALALRVLGQPAADTLEGAARVFDVTAIPRWSWTLALRGDHPTPDAIVVVPTSGVSDGSATPR
jgi:glutamyl/glutaminyl-tRNA synthetase